MALTLELAIAKQRVPLGSEVAMQLTLRNTGPDAVETASLFDNNTITNYMLSNEQDEPIGIYNHVTRQLLWEKTEPRTDDFRLITLGPGQAELREQNLCEWHWIDEPGVYLVRGRYVFGDVELTSPPQRVEVLSAPLVSLDYQWTYHYSERYLLESSWVVEDESGGFCAYTRQSARFRPQVIKHNPPFHKRDRPFAPRVSFERSLLAGGPVWRAWLDGTDVECVRLTEGRVELGPLRFATDLEQLRWVAPPLAARSGEVSLILSGTDSAGIRRVLALGIDAQGSAVQRRRLGADFALAEAIAGVSDAEGGYRLLWHTGSEVFAWDLDLSSLSPIGQPRMLWSTDKAIQALLVPPVLGEQRLCCAMATHRDPAFLAFAWLHVDEEDNPAKEERMRFAGTASIASCTGEMNELGHVFALLRSNLGLHYVNATLMQWMEVVGAEQAAAFTHERLVVSPRGDVFCTANRLDRGLTEWRLHRGEVEDLEEAARELGEDEAER